MRLISNFKDYYDNLQDPTDKDLTYVRIKKVLDADDPVSGKFATIAHIAAQGLGWVNGPPLDSAGEQERVTSLSGNSNGETK